MKTLRNLMLLIGVVSLLSSCLIQEPRYGRGRGDNHGHHDRGRGHGRGHGQGRGHW